MVSESTIDSEGFKGGTRGSPIMPRDAVSRTANVGMVGKNGLTRNVHVTQLWLRAPRVQGLFILFIIYIFTNR